MVKIIRNYRSGMSLISVVVGASIAAGGLVISSSLMKSSSDKEMRMRHQQVVTSLHSLGLERIATGPVGDYFKAAIKADSAHRACFFEAGALGAGGNCRVTYGLPASDDDAWQNLPDIKAADGVTSLIFNEKSGVNSGDTCTGSACVAERKVSYRWSCVVAHCTGIEFRVTTRYMGKYSGITPTREGKIFFSKSALEGNRSYTYDASCTGDFLVGSVSVKEGIISCKSLPLNQCGNGAGGRATVLNNFATTGSCATTLIAQVPGTKPQGLRRVSLFDRELTWVAPKGAAPEPFCGENAKVGIVIGKNFDKTKGHNYGDDFSWDKVQDGLPYPCEIEYSYHVNLCGKGKEARVKVDNSQCPRDVYTVKLVQVSGSNAIKCSGSNSDVTCTMKSDGCADMDNVNFVCFFDKNEAKKAKLRTTWNHSDLCDHDCNSHFQWK